MTQTVLGEAPIVARVLVEGVTEWGDEAATTAGGEAAAYLVDQALGVGGVLDDGVAIDSVEDVVAERHVLGVTSDVDARQRIEVDVEVAVDVGTGAADVEIAPAERHNRALTCGAVDEGQRGLQPAQPAIGSFTG